MKQFKTRKELIEWQDAFAASRNLSPLESILHPVSSEDVSRELIAQGYDISNLIADEDSIRYRVSFVNGEMIAEFFSPDFVSREDAMRLAGIEIFCDRNGAYVRYNGNKYDYESITVSIFQ